MLVGELGLDPGPDLVAVEQAILHQDPSLLPGPDGGASPVCPYPGLLAYGIDQAEDYFGRDDDIEACRAILDREGVLAVVGPSGSGKSSLVRAGVAAAARRDGTAVAVITPGAHPAAALAEAHVLGSPAMLVVDQAEEVVTVCPDVDERAGLPRRRRRARRLRGPPSSSRCARTGSGSSRGTPASRGCSSAASTSSGR